MPEENAQNNTLPKSSKTLRRVDTCANIAIWCAAIAWGSFILFIIFAIIDSSPTIARVFDGIVIPIFCIMMLANLVSLFNGIIGLIRTIIKRKESSGIIRAIIAIILSLALFAVVIPAIQVSPPRHRMDRVQSIKTEDVDKLKWKAEPNEVNQPVSR
jgi:hypothetical protein